MITVCADGGGDGLLLLLVWWCGGGGGCGRRYRQTCDMLGVLVMVLVDPSKGSGGRESVGFVGGGGGLRGVWSGRFCREELPATADRRR